MTKEEFTAKRFASQVKIAKQREAIRQIELEHGDLLAVKLEKPLREKQRLEDADEDEATACLAEVNFFPFKRHDFITRGDGDYYEVQKVEVDLAYVDRDAIQPPKDFVRLVVEATAIRKSGVLARYSTRLRLDRYQDGEWRKADMSEHLCLRRALKQRMRRRLEGGD